jgi:hypothetical protein
MDIMGYAFLGAPIYIGLHPLTRCVIFQIRYEKLEETMSPVKRIARIFKPLPVSGRKDAKRSTLRKQLFYERQLSAMKRWDQVAVVSFR